MASDEWRVEVELGEEHGLSLGERLRSLDLDDEARERLGERVIVTRDGPHLFLYAPSREAADEAARVVRELVAGDELTAEVRVTRWHPVAAEWKDADLPLPASDEERAAERTERATREGDEEGISHPGFVLLERYKPEFMRDLGL
jgi:hypothetical protein